MQLPTKSLKVRDEQDLDTPLLACKHKLAKQVHCSQYQLNTKRSVENCVSAVSQSRNIFEKKVS